MEREEVFVCSCGRYHKVIIGDKTIYHQEFDDEDLGETSGGSYVLSSDE